MTDSPATPYRDGCGRGLPNTDPGTTIDNGLLTVAAGETAAALTVRATSSVNPAKFGTAIVTVTPASNTGTWWQGRYTYGSDYVELRSNSAALGTVHK
jgi:hypothetical protein